MGWPSPTMPPLAFSNRQHDVPRNKPIPSRAQVCPFNSPCRSCMSASCRCSAGSHPAAVPGAAAALPSSAGSMSAANAAAATGEPAANRRMAEAAAAGSPASAAETKPRSACCASPAASSHL